jgi:SAM-dependent methyltransferase
MSTDAVIDLRGGKDPEAEMILGWPNTVTDLLKSRLVALQSGSTLRADELRELTSARLLNHVTCEPSPLGKSVIDLLVREQWQEGDEFETAMQETVSEPIEGPVLEVGCSTGRRLRMLRHPLITQRVGVDVNAKALALGCRLARQENQSVSFHHCSAHSLPFSSNSFNLVICRNALTYMHQRTALREMTRVLKPNGVLFVRFENIRFDLQLLLPPKTLTSSIVYGRNFLFGVTLDVLGWQPIPGSRYWGWRAFATLRQLRKRLQQSDCDIIGVEEARNCARFMGSSTQTTLLARKSK